MPSKELDVEAMARIDELRDGRIGPVESEEIVKVVRCIIDGMNAGLPAKELSVRSDLEALADYIEVAKTEIMSIDPEGISDEHLPTATVELDAIVRATEDATQSIMGAAERIEAVAADLDEANGQALTDATTRIFEACGFQDITGQRISKVIKVLHEIEDKVEGLISIFGDNDPDAREERRRQRAAEREQANDAAPEEIDDRDLLQGPQSAEDAISQDDIDAIFAGMD
jgi:chemotaxis protein CheZ